MTTQELFIGHFEGALTPEESLHLETMLSGSAELRAQFDQHQQVHSMMVREAEETKPSEALDEATIGAALGLLGQTIGGGAIAFWTGTKIAATIGAVVVGGTVTWFAVTKNSEPQLPQQPQTPVATQPAPTIQTAPAPQLKQPETIQQTAVGDQPAKQQQRNQLQTPSATSKPTANNSGKNQPADPAAKPLDLGNRGPDVTLEKGTIMSTKKSNPK